MIDNQTNNIFYNKLDLSDNLQNRSLKNIHVRII